MTVARVPIPVVMNRVMTAVTQVERRVRSLIHLERMERTGVWRAEAAETQATAREDRPAQ